MSTTDPIRSAWFSHPSQPVVRERHYDNTKGKKLTSVKGGRHVPISEALALILDGWKLESVTHESGLYERAVRQHVWIELALELGVCRTCLQSLPRPKSPTP